MKVLQDRGPSWTENIVALQRDTQKGMDKHAYAQALKDVNKFGTDFKEASEPELAKKLEELRATIKRRAEAAPKKISDTVKKLMEEKKKDEALKLLQEAKEGLEGFAQPLEKIDTEIQALNKAK
jgi:translation initiation factor IF-2